MENKDGKKDMINEYKQERTNLNEEINRKIHTKMSGKGERIKKKII